VAPARTAMRQPRRAAPAPARGRRRRARQLRYRSKGQAGDSSTTGSATSAVSASRAASATTCERTGDDMWHPAFQLHRKARRRLAYQVGLADAREKPASRKYRRS
jgi:hypothetical protein